MKQTWRWFGPADGITIPEIVQTGAEGVVSALHHVPPGQVWSQEEIRKRQHEIAGSPEAPSGLSWDVVESLPVSEVLKTREGPVAAHLDAYRESLANIAACGIRTVCYNFMPVLDWTRTELAAPMPGGARAMRFDLVDFCVFDRHILGRAAADDDFPEELRAAAQARFADMSDDDRRRLADNVVAGLPGANDSWTLGDVRAHLDRYAAIDGDRLRRHLVAFLSEVVPTAERLGIRLCCHPDDPPFPLLGLPRVVSSEADYAHLMEAVDSPASGITFCTGSLGVAEGFDPAGFIRRLGSRIHFVHLRNTRRTGPVRDGRSSFYEAAHLEGDTDMAATVRALVEEEARRRAAGRADHRIPMRPDHGQSILSDHDRSLMPGYPLIGRMRGLAELRGLMAAFESL
ncbi:mannonate dehydratase [Limimaricola pyoseonensis]|uniref:Mannonate dehydratase n=1 Tax=Limimaricola pyoseonensis TaxID=521013 RepID=A0A1G7EZA9_9RHOB|nr:mannonate dehydratase [Limimaricola pyoseonensis]SDE68806.1 D-mannonate dehydratase [Limimaricola pyoseonensis]